MDVFIKVLRDDLRMRFSYNNAVMSVVLHLDFTPGRRRSNGGLWVRVISRDLIVPGIRITESHDRPQIRHLLHIPITPVSIKLLALLPLIPTLLLRFPCPLRNCWFLLIIGVSLMGRTTFVASASPHPVFSVRGSEGAGAFSSFFALFFLAFTCSSTIAGEDALFSFPSVVLAFLGSPTGDGGVIVRFLGAFRLGGSSTGEGCEEDKMVCVD